MNKKRIEEPENKDESRVVRVSLYARVSKDEAASYGALQDPENQLHHLRQHCQAMNWQIVEEFVDRASGASPNRPGFKRMLQAAQKKEFDVILVWALDRFSRQGMSATLDYIKQLRKAGIGLKSLQESWLDTTKEGVGDLLIAIFSWIAEQERERISERTRASLQLKFSQGKLGSKPPFGYKLDKRSHCFVIDQKEAETVRKTYQWYLQGLGEKLIATLAEIPRHQVRNVLRNPAYLGHRVRAGIVQEGKHEPIIDKETWERLQAEIRKRKAGYGSKMVAKVVEGLK